tara:strand:+ start:509 stop:1060 length:552 start_codon:yes stop_codon:yes gene_type:complete
MIRFFFLILIFFLVQNNSIASIKKNTIENLKKIENMSFSFVQTIGGKDEKGDCTIQYPKKIFCKYESRINKILVSNGTSLVIKNDRQYYRYPLKSTPLEFILNKNYLIKKIETSKLNKTNDKYFYFEIDEENNKINIFFNKEDFKLVGWQVEDIYQNLAVTYIFNSEINKNVDEKIFKLPANN